MYRILNQHPHHLRKALLVGLSDFAAQKRVDEVSKQPLVFPVGPIKAEKSVAFMGIFQASTPRSKRQKRVAPKTVTLTRIIDGKKLEIAATAEPSATYGYPTNVHLKKLLGFWKIAEAKQRQNGGVLANPVSFTSPQLFALLKLRSDGRDNYQAIREFLNVFAHLRFTLSEAVSNSKTQAKRRKDRTFAFFSDVKSLLVTTAAGQTADAHEVHLSQYLLDNINAGYLLPVDLDQFLALKTSIAQTLLLPLKVWLFASQNQGYFELLYSRVCEQIDIAEHRHRSRILQQMKPPLDELIAKTAFYHRWSLERTKDRKQWKLCFWHSKNPGQGSTQASDRAQDHPPEVGKQPSSELVTRFGEWGISERDAQNLLSALPPDQPILEQLEYAEQEIHRSGPQIENPAGFIIHRLQGNAPVPEHFVSDRKKQDTEERSQRRRESQAGLERAYEDYLSDLVSQHIRADYTDEGYRAYLAAKKQKLAQYIPNQTEEMLSAMAEASIRQEFLQKISDRIPFNQFCEEKKRSAEAEK